MKNTLTPTLQEMQALYHLDLSSFIQFTFGVLYSDIKYHHNWHIDVIADKLMQCYRGEIKRLIINVPPRSLKSTCASIAFPAWVLINQPSARCLCISYGDGLVKDFGGESRRLMTSPQFKALFPNTLISSKSHSATRLRLVNGGLRQGISAGGPITGRGGDFIIIDDPLKASDANSKERGNINQWYDDNIYQRLNNKNTGVIIVVMQRLHEDDLTAHLLAQTDDWELLELKAIAEDDEEYRLAGIGGFKSKDINDKGADEVRDEETSAALKLFSGGTLYTRKLGEALHPRMESLKQLEKAKQSFGGYVFASQYQQDPQSDKAAIIRRDWFKEYDRELIPAIEQRSTASMSSIRYQFNPVIQSWDTALTANEGSDYSVCVTLGVRDNHYYVLDVFRGKLRFAELREMVKQLRNRFNADRVVVEDSPAGHHLIEALRGDYLPIEGYKPSGDKYTRMSAISGYIESGLVYVPNEASWLDDFIAEVTRFPNVKHDDQVDAFSQAMKVAISDGFVGEWVI